MMINKYRRLQRFWLLTFDISLIITFSPLFIGAIKCIKENVTSTTLILPLWFKCITLVASILICISPFFVSYYKNKIVNDPNYEENRNKRYKLWKDCMECNKYLAHLERK